MNAAGLLYPDILGNRYSRTSVIDISIDNVLSIEGCDGFSVHRKLARGKSWGHRMKAQGRTRGRFEFDAKMKVWTDDYNLILTYLRGKSSAGEFNVAFSLSISIFEQSLGTTLWQLIGCSIADENGMLVEDSLAGPELDKELEFDVMEILKDGISAGLENSPFGQIGA